MYNNLNQNPILPNERDNIEQPNNNIDTSNKTFFDDYENNDNITSIDNSIPNTLNENIDIPTSLNIDNNNNLNYINPIDNNITTNINNNDDEELLKAFIGKNYEKITTKSFNYPGFFFNSLYMFYRKMFGLGFLSSIIISIILTLVLNFVFGVSGFFPCFLILSLDIPFIFFEELLFFDSCFFVLRPSTNRTALAIWSQL